MSNQSIYRNQVARCTESRHYAQADACRDRLMAKLFTGVDIGHVSLDDGKTSCHDGVAQRHAGVAESTRVKDDPVGPVRSVLQAVDERSLNIRLRIAYLGLVPNMDTNCFDHIVERVGSVHLGLARTEHVQIRPVEDKDLVCHIPKRIGTRVAVRSN